MDVAVISTLVGSCCDQLCLSWRSNYDSFTKLDENYANLLSLTAQLQSKLELVERQSREISGREEVTPVCKNWLREVKQELDKKELEYTYTQHSSEYRRAHKFLPAANLSEDIVARCERLERLLNSENYTPVSQRRSLDPVLQILVSPQECDFPSQRQIVDKLIDWLKNEEIRRIGLLGQVGIGKSTILRNLINELSRELSPDFKLFDNVIFVDVSKLIVEEEVIATIRRAICDRLNIPYQSESSELVNEISRKLAKRTCLLILDEVLCKVNLCNVGIGKEYHTTGNTTWKVVIATRDKEICSEMETDVEITVKSSGGPGSQICGVGA